MSLRLAHVLTEKAKFAASQLKHANYGKCSAICGFVQNSSPNHPSGAASTTAKSATIMQIKHSIPMPVAAHADAVFTAWRLRFVIPRQFRVRQNIDNSVDAFAKNENFCDDDEFFSCGQVIVGRIGKGWFGFLVPWFH